MEELIELFQDSGYDVRLPWQVLDAANYGVPQHRQRLILMGAKRGLPVPAYPPVRTSPADKPNTAQAPVGPNCEQALGDLPDADRFDILNETDEVATQMWGRPSQFAREMRCLDNGAWHFGHVRDWNPTVLTSSTRTGHTDISRRRFAAVKPGKVEPISRFFKLNPKGLSNTLRAGTDGARGAFTSPRPTHYRYARCVTVREIARLHGFPDWFRFNETKWHGARQIGNAVPPPLARAIGDEVIRALGIEPMRPDLRLRLGEDRLLRMDASSAAAYFGVDAPNSKRDRKSGARKRKQSETEAWRLSRELSVG